VADYSAALVPELAARARLDLFSGAGISALPHLSGRYDAVVSVIGNSPHHAEIYEHAVARGSAVICHDSRLLGLAVWHGGEAAAAGMASRELDRLVTPAEIAGWVRDERTRQASFLGDLAAAARPLMLHSRPPAALVARRFGVTARVLPFAMQRVFAARDPVAKAAARSALKFYPGQKIVASFGFIGRNKGIEAALHAFAKLRDRVDAILVFVGEHTDVTPIYEELAWQLGIANAVKFGTEFVCEARYRKFLLAADAGLQLREGGLGNISGALQDCVAAGLPSVATRDLAENIGAPGYVTRVGDGLEPAEIADALERVLEGPRICVEDERRAQCERYSMGRYTEALLRELGF
jgi:glycosyltransferase involved in cell wall biosynthesis